MTWEVSLYNMVSVVHERISQKPTCLMFDSFDKVAPWAGSMLALNRLKKVHPVHVHHDDTVTVDDGFRPVDAVGA